MENKNDITAGDGKKHDIIEWKAEASTTITSRTFEYLESKGIPTHYREQISATEVLIDNCDMIPLECVWRFVETGSYHKREKSVHGDNANPDGTVLPEFVMEFFYKNDVILTDGSIISDPLMELNPNTQTPKIEGGKLVLLHPNTGKKLDYIAIENPSTKQVLEDEDIKKDIQVISENAYLLREQTIKIGSELKSLYMWADLHLQDFKVEYWKRKRDGRVVLADVIDADSKRLSAPIILEWEKGARYLWKDVKPGYAVNMYLQNKYLTPFKEYSTFMYAMHQYHINKTTNTWKALKENLINTIYEQFLRNKKVFSKIISDHDIGVQLLSQDAELFENALDITKGLLQQQVTQLSQEVKEKYWYNVLDSDDDWELQIPNHHLQELRELFGKLVDTRTGKGYRSYDPSINIARYVEWEWLDKQWYRDGWKTWETWEKYKKLARIITELTQKLNIPVTYVDAFAKHVQEILSRQN